jgi:hypothetical protein
MLLRISFLLEEDETGGRPPYTLTGRDELNGDPWGRKSA